uniref:Uncharacterized protein n=1 Tax=viral metagenome TaxID=1070528 RepID=A0A6H1ZU43_9ZZZZ
MIKMKARIKDVTKEFGELGYLGDIHDDDIYIVNSDLDIASLTGNSFGDYREYRDFISECDSVILGNPARRRRRVRRRVRRRPPFYVFFGRSKRVRTPWEKLGNLAIFLGLVGVAIVIAPTVLRHTKKSVFETGEMVKISRDVSAFRPSPSQGKPIQPI